MPWDIRHDTYQTGANDLQKQIKLFHNNCYQMILNLVRNHQQKDQTLR